MRLARRLVLDHIVIIELASRAELAQQAIALEQAHTTSRSGNRMPRAYVAGAARSPPATGSPVNRLVVFDLWFDFPQVGRKYVLSPSKAAMACKRPHGLL